MRTTFSRQFMSSCHTLRLFGAEATAEYTVPAGPTEAAAPGPRLPVASRFDIIPHGDGVSHGRVHRTLARRSPSPPARPRRARHRGLLLRGREDPRPRRLWLRRPELRGDGRGVSGLGG